MRIGRFLLLGLILVGCSTHTTTTLKVDLASFIPEGQRRGVLDLSSLSGTAYLPSQEGEALSLPAEFLRALLEGRLEAEVFLQNQGNSDVTVKLEARVGPEGDADIFDGTGDQLFGQAELNLGPGGEGLLNLEAAIGENQNPGAFNLIRSGAFRIGLKLEVSAGAGQVGYEVRTAWVSFRARLFRLLQ